MENFLKAAGAFLLIALFVAVATVASVNTDKLNKRTREAISRGYATYDSNGQFTWREQR